MTENRKRVGVVLTGQNRAAAVGVTGQQRGVTIANPLLPVRGSVGRCDCEALTNGDIDEVLDGISPDDMDGEGNLLSALKLAHARQIRLSGAAQGAAYFDGSRDVEITTVLEQMSNADILEIMTGV